MGSVGVIDTEALRPAMEAVREAEAAWKALCDEWRNLQGVAKLETAGDYAVRLQAAEQRYLRACERVVKAIDGTLQQGRLSGGSPLSTAPWNRSDPDE